jgi:hypothetical protein
MQQINLLISDRELGKINDFMNRWNKKYPEGKLDKIEYAASWILMKGLDSIKKDNPELYEG